MIVWDMGSPALAGRYSTSPGLWEGLIVALQDIQIAGGVLRLEEEEPVGREVGLREEVGAAVSGAG
ncbi:MAG: hypothetical protein ACREXW_14435 [Gammaproteobacteria bacterium]